MIDNSKQTKGKWWYEYKWVSICSAHGFKGPQKECLACQAGYWVNTWKSKIGGFIHDHFYKLWRWYMNRPNSKARKQIMELFPKLK